MADAVLEIRRTMIDPIRVSKALGLMQGAKRQSGGLLVRCVWHDDGEASCSVTRGPDGTLRAKCFACGMAGDVIAFVAARFGISTRSSFREVLTVCAEVGGLHSLAYELNGGRVTESRQIPPMPELIAQNDYPDPAEVESTWRDAVAIERNGPAKEFLRARGILASEDVARALTGFTANLPWWASYRSTNWWDAGYQIVVPVYDHLGELRSLRAWRTFSGDGPKRLPAAGRRAAGLCMANPAARHALARGKAIELLIVEGEPDYLSACQRQPAAPIIGVGSGMWNAEWATRVPRGSRVLIDTHPDEAGERYALAIAASLKGKAEVKR